MVRQRKADDRVADLAPIVKELQAAGKTSLRAIAEGLNAQDIPTARGEGEWTATRDAGAGGPREAAAAREMISQL